jgi:hypothetical protein
MSESPPAFPGVEALEASAEAVLVRVHLLALLDAIDARQATEDPHHSPLRRSRSASPSGSFSSSPALVQLKSEDFAYELRFAGRDPGTKTNKESERLLGARG